MKSYLKSVGQPYQGTEGQGRKRKRKMRTSGGKILVYKTSQTKQG
jgi:hypothetical protein